MNRSGLYERRSNYINYSYNFQRCSKCIHLLRCNDCYSNFCIKCKDDISYCYECNSKYCINCNDVNYCDRCDSTYCINCRYVYECKYCNLHLCESCILNHDVLDMLDDTRYSQDPDVIEIVSFSQDKLRKCSACRNVYCKTCKKMYKCNKTGLYICITCAIVCNICCFVYNPKHCIGNTCDDCKFDIIQQTCNDITKKVPFEIIQLIKKYI